MPGSRTDGVHRDAATIQGMAHAFNGPAAFEKGRRNLMEALKTFVHERWAVSGLIIVCLWLAFNALIAPLREREHQLQSKATVLHGQLSDARNEAAEIQELELKTASGRVELHRLDNEFPSSSPRQWVPERIKKHFDRYGFAQLTTSVKSAVDEPGMPGYERISWKLNLPVQNVTQASGSLLLAVADLEQTERVVRVKDVEIHKDADEPVRSTAAVNFSTLVRKESK